MAVQFITSPNVCFYTTSGKKTKLNMRPNMQKREKNIPNIIDRNLKHDYQISVISGVLVCDTTGY